MFSIKFVSKPDNSFSVACIQLCSGIDIETNLHQSEQYIRQAASEGASLICTPEMTHLFQRDSKRLLDTARYEEDDKGLVYYCSLAKELSVTLVIGSLAIKASNKRCVNRGYSIDSQGEVIARYDKIHLFDATVGEEAHHESHTYIAGNQAVVANTNNVRIGMTICYDLRFPQLFLRPGNSRRTYYCCPGGIYCSNRAGALAYSTTGPRDRNGLLHSRPRSMRHSRGWPQNIRPFADSEPMGRSALRRKRHYLRKRSIDYAR